MADDEFNPSQATTKAKNQTVVWMVVLLMIAISLIAFGCTPIPADTGVDPDALVQPRAAGCDPRPAVLR